MRRPPALDRHPRHSTVTRAPRGGRWTSRVILAAVYAAVLALPGSVQASPRDDVKMAYIDASEQLSNLEVEAAIATLDAAIARAQAAGLGTDPSLAPLHAMRAGLLHSSGANAAQVLTAFKHAVRADYNVKLPIELRSEELQSLLEDARASVEKPAPDPVLHRPPPVAKGQDIEFGALFNVPLPPESEVVLYWRKVGTTGEYNAVYMDLFGNFATATVPAAQHADADLEYFFYSFDANQRALANRGDRDNPLLLRQGGAATTDEPTAAGPSADQKLGRRPRPSGMPRVFLNFGFGTGFGIARGRAELTYEQYRPDDPTAPYGLREQACALERWFEAGAPLADDANEFAANLNQIGSVSNALPAPAEDLAMAYDADYCKRRHPVSTGLASAPFHLAPEVGVRLGRAFVISAFARLQVVTGSRVESDDPNKELNESFNVDVRSANPAGVRLKPPFSWAVGAKVRYFFGEDDNKFRMFTGGFLGYGNARLRVPMGFSNDRNGNSVPDASEVGLAGPRDATGNVIAATCVPVWPYNQGCMQGPAGDADRALAQAVAASTSSRDQRIDTVRIGPGFVGGLFGVHYQVVKYFGVFAELGVGVWFPNTSSLLFDLTLGPVVTF